MPDLKDLGFLRVGAVSPELKVADTVFNTGKIIESIEEARKEKCYFLLFPELSITGYTCGDLFYQKKLQDSAIESILRIKEHTGKANTTAIVGAPILNRGRLFNCAVMISSGKIAGIVPKTYLCNTKEYYEERWFSSEFDRRSDHILIDNEQVPFGADLLFSIVSHPECIFGIEICEDLWALIPPSLSMAAAGANLFFNLSASNEYLGKDDYREQLVLSHSARTLSAYVYSSSGAGESSTDLSFPGKCMIGEYGKILAESAMFGFDTKMIFSEIDYERLNIERTMNNSFASSLQSIAYRTIPISLESSDTDVFSRSYSPSPFVPQDRSIRAKTCEKIFSIQTHGLAKRMKHIDSSNLSIGISGGLDSTLALMVCVRTMDMLGYDLKNINAVSMPGFGTTKRTKSNAEKLAEQLGVTFREIPIDKAVSQHFKDIDHDPSEKDVVYENAQARERTQILMDIANQTKGIVIGTGDLSELALGWCTYNADQMSMYGVNAGVPKTLVSYIINWLAEDVFEGEISKILNDVAATPISPELLPPDEKGRIAQHTEERIGPYSLNDFFLYYAIRCHYPPDKVLFLAEHAFYNIYERDIILKWLKKFYVRFFSQQFKRSCMPDGIKVGTVSLSPRGDWRMPSDAEARIWLDQIKSLKD